MQFQYRAVKQGKLETKRLEANNEKEVVAYLKENDYFLINIKQVGGVQSGLFALFVNRVTANDIVDMTRQFAIMLNAGLTIVEALGILKRQIGKESLRKVIEDIESQIKAGNTMSSVLKQYPQYFSSLYISLVKSGEASGKLADILLQLSETLEKQREFRGKLKGALIYPVIVVAAMISVIFIVVTFVVPKLLDLYANFNLELPFSTKILIAVSSFSALFWPLIIAVTVGGILLLRNYFRTKKGKYVFDSFVLRIPIVKNVIQMASLVESTRTLSILVGSGVAILDGINIVIETTRNVVYKDAFRNVYQQVEKGRSLGDAFAQQKVFPPILVQMVIVGENTGHLDDTLGRLAKYFEFESELAIRAATTLIEPTILVVLGAAVGFLVFSIITPIYNLTSSFQ